MPDFSYERDQQRLFCLGMDLNRPVDAVKPLHFPILKNVRAYQNGRIESRPGIALIGTAGTGIHSIRRLNDPAASAYARIIGDSTKLYTGTTTFAERDSGYSGYPLALVPFRPGQSTYSWMYIGDSVRMRKVNAAGTVHQIGAPAPLTAPIATLALPSYKIIEECDTYTDWTAGTHTTISAGDNPQSRVNTTITAILFDSGTTGWCSINPADMLNIGAGTHLAIGTGGTLETVIVHSTRAGSVATIIAATNGITYDSGTTGACSIVLRDSLPQLSEDSLLYNSTVGAYARILAVIDGPDGTKSIRTSTAAQWSAGNAVQLVTCFRCVCAYNHAATEVVTAVALRARVDTASSTTWVQKSLGGADLTTIATGLTAGKDDYIHISMAIRDPSRLVEGKIMFDYSNSATFASDYSYKVFRAADLTPNLYNLSDYYESVVEAAKIKTADPGGISSQMGLNRGWGELRFKISDLIRVGSNDKVGLNAVYYFRIQLTMTEGTETIIDIDSVNLFGGYGPDLGTIGTPYLYRYRVRCSTTGAVSAWSPATQGGLDPLRQRIYVVIPAQYTSAAEADLIDFQRFGGNLPEWHEVGTVANPASPTTFTDTFPDDVVVIRATTPLPDYQLWPLLGTPLSGTTSKVSGTMVTITGTDTFQTYIAPGTRIEINGILYTIYRIISTTVCELNENAGSQGAVAWRIVEPIYVGRPLPCLWGPINDVRNAPTLFACGDPINPQRLYFTNGGAESAADTNWIDITSPSEPLQNGVIYNGRCYVFSTERMFQVYPDSSNDKWTYAEIPNSTGLFSRWAITGFQSFPGPLITFLGKNGIFQTDGGTPRSITDDTLFPLFPNEGNLGQTVNSIAPPNIVAAQAEKFRLSCYDDYLYFDYIDTASARCTLVYISDLMEGRGGWVSLDTYSPSIAVHYGEEGNNIHALLCGSTTGSLYLLSGVSDAGSAIAGQIRTPSRDQGDSRLNKLYGDIVLDAKTNSVNVTATPGFNNHASTGTAATINTATRLQTPFNVSTSWYTARNVSLDLVWSSTTGGLEFYLWEPRWHEEGAPISALSWEICETSFGLDGFVYTGDMFLAHISSANLSLVFTIDEVAQPAITVAHGSGALAKAYIRLPVMKGKMWKLRLSSSVAFRVHGNESELRVKQWGSGGEWRSVRMFNDLAVSQVAA